MGDWLKKLGVNRRELWGNQIREELTWAIEQVRDELSISHIASWVPASKVHRSMSIMSQHHIPSVQYG